MVAGNFGIVGVAILPGCGSQVEQTNTLLPLVITHPSPLYPPFPKIVWEEGNEDGTLECAGGFPCGLQSPDKDPLKYLQVM